MALKIEHCPNCGSDRIEKVCQDWTGTDKDQSYVLPGLVFYECPACGERFFDCETMAYIQAISPGYAAQWESRDYMHMQNVKKADPARLTLDEVKAALGL